MNGVIYARYSSENQREESIEGQIRECTAFAEKNNIEIVDTYIDRALSAKTDNRPSFQKMVKDSDRKLFDVIIVWKLDRFARNRYDSARYKTRLKKNGVRVISATEAISEGSEGIILEAVLEGMAEYYSADLSEKVVRGMTENALKLKFNGGAIPFGYYVDKDEQKLKINPETSPYVISIFKMYDERVPMNEIARRLNKKGLRNTKGGKFTTNIISNILRNRRYIGEYRYRDIVVPDGIPAIVPKELFERIQTTLNNNKKAPSKFSAEDEYILSTKLYCGKCMSFMVGESGRSHTMAVYRYYRCISSKRHNGCDTKSVRKDLIEDFVIDKIKEFLFDDELIKKVVKAILKAQKEGNSELPILNKQLSEIKFQINNLLKAIQQGLLNESTKKRFEELEEERKELELAIAKEKLKKPILTEEKLLCWFDLFKYGDFKSIDFRRKLVNVFVNSIILYDDKIELHFNFKENAEILKLKKGSDGRSNTQPKIGKLRQRFVDFLLLLLLL